MADEQPFVHPVDQLEPGALSGTALLPTSFIEDPALRIQMSIAISLKRLADHLAGTSKTCGLVHAIYDAAAARQ